jgi:thiamine pyrophosphate-dependent acetolactate synthase large subunit-like protein
MREAMEWAASTPGCTILDIAIEQERNVYPMIPSGQSVAAMIEDPVPARFRTGEAAGD